MLHALLYINYCKKDYEIKYITYSRRAHNFYWRTHSRPWACNDSMCFICKNSRQVITVSRLK